MKYASIRYVLLALPGRERLCLHPHPSEEVQHPLRKKETEVVLVELCLCSILIHDHKDTSFHGIYLHGRKFTSCQTRKFAGELGWHSSLQRLPASMWNIGICMRFAPITLRQLCWCHRGRARHPASWRSSTYS